MKNNENQVKSDGLPVVSENEQVQKNSMRLYIYLVSISQFQGRNQPRVFTQRDFTINGIHTLLGLHEKTIKKYWRLLEENSLIKYEGPRDMQLELVDWDKAFMHRKKNKAGFYTIPKSPKGYIYRIMPRETIDKIQKEFLINETELKLYLLLANMQEHFCYMKPPERIFTITDLRHLLKLTKQNQTNKTIAMGLIWLKKLKLIEYSIERKKNNLGTECAIFHLEAVNYYTNGGEIMDYIDQDYSVLSEGVKNSILTENLVKIDYLL